MGFLPAASPDNVMAAGYFIPVDGNQLLCNTMGLWQPLSRSEFDSLSLPVRSQHFVACFNQQPCWVVEVDKPVDELPSRYQWLGLRSQLGLIDEQQFQLAGQALQVLQWHHDHRFCGRCGAPTVADEIERAKLCRPCELSFYPRLSPCILTLITRGNECLLARHVRSTQPIYTALAGFVEVGESLEDTIHREIQEEVGLKVRGLRYVHSQPWPFPGQLMLGFFAEYESGNICLDVNEIIDAGWYRYDRLPPVPPIATLSGQLINHFVQQHSR